MLVKRWSNIFPKVLCLFTELRTKDYPTKVINIDKRVTKAEGQSIDDKICLLSLLFHPGNQFFSYIDRIYSRAYSGSSSTIIKSWLNWSEWEMQGPNYKQICIMYFLLLHLQISCGLAPWSWTRFSLSLLRCIFFKPTAIQVIFYLMKKDKKARGHI